MKVVFLSRVIILTWCLRRAPCNYIPNLGAVGVLEFAPFPTLPSLAFSVLTTHPFPTLPYLAVAQAALAFSALTTHPFPTLPSLAVVEAALAFSMVTKQGRAGAGHGYRGALSAAL